MAEARGSDAWYAFVDNDKLASPGYRDRDYTGGLAIAKVSDSLSDTRLYFDGSLQWLNGLLPLSAASQPASVTRSMEAGTSAFTPLDAATSEPVHDDRPFANIVFWAQSLTTTHNGEKPSTNTATLSVGMLGTRLGEVVQRGIHEVTGDPQAQGWRNQISDGGEPTFRISLHRQRLLTRNSVRRLPNLEISMLYKINVGYLTDAGSGAVVRWGRIRSPSWSLAPFREEYAQKSPSPASAHRSAGEWFLWGGLFGRARLYNALLQGQFRNSKVTFSSDRLRRWLGELKLGAVFRHKRGWEISYQVTFHTTEFRDSALDHSVRWGSFHFAKAM